MLLDDVKEQLDEGTAQAAKLGAAAARCNGVGSEGRELVARTAALEDAVVVAA